MLRQDEAEEELRKKHYQQYYYNLRFVFERVAIKDPIIEKIMADFDNHDASLSNGAVADSYAGDCLERAGQPLLALSCYERAVEKFSHDCLSWLNIAKITYLNQKNHTKALQILQKIMADYNCYAAYLLQGIFYYQENKLPQARLAFINTLVLTEQCNFPLSEYDNINDIILLAINNLTEFAPLPTADKLKVIDSTIQKINADLKNPATSEAQHEQNILLLTSYIQQQPRKYKYYYLRAYCYTQLKKYSECEADLSIGMWQAHAQKNFTYMRKLIVERGHTTNLKVITERLAAKNIVTNNEPSESKPMFSEHQDKVEKPEQINYTLFIPAEIDDSVLRTDFSEYHKLCQQIDKQVLDMQLLPALDTCKLAIMNCNYLPDAYIKAGDILTALKTFSQQPVAAENPLELLQQAIIFYKQAIKLSPENSKALRALSTLQLKLNSNEYSTTFATYRILNAKETATRKESYDYIRAHIRKKGLVSNETEKLFNAKSDNYDPELMNGSESEYFLGLSALRVNKINLAIYHFEMATLYNRRHILATIGLAKVYLLSSLFIEQSLKILGDIGEDYGSASAHKLKAGYELNNKLGDHGKKSFIEAFKYGDSDFFVNFISTSNTMEVAKALKGINNTNVFQAAESTKLQKIVENLIKSNNKKPLGYSLLKNQLKEINQAKLAFPTDSQYFLFSAKANFRIGDAYKEIKDESGKILNEKSRENYYLQAWEDAAIAIWLAYVENNTTSINTAFEIRDKAREEFIKSQQVTMQSIATTKTPNIAASLSREVKALQAEIKDLSNLVSNGQTHLSDLTSRPKSNPDQYFPAYQQLLIEGKIRHRNKLFENAEAFFQAAIRSMPEIPDAYIELGVLYADQSKDELALENFLTANRIIPANCTELNRIADQYEKMSDTIKAAEFRTQAESANYIEMCYFADYLQVLRKYLPNQPKLTEQSRIILETKNDSDSVLNACKSASLYTYVGDQFLKQKKYFEAAYYFNIACTLFSQDFFSTYKLLLCYEALHYYDYQSLLKKSAILFDEYEYPPFLYLLGKSLLNTGEIADGKNSLTNAIALMENNELEYVDMAFDILNLIYTPSKLPPKKNKSQSILITKIKEKAQENLVTALTYCENELKRDSANPELLMETANIFFNLENYAQALIYSGLAIAILKDKNTSSTLIKEYLETRQKILDHIQTLPANHPHIKHHEYAFRVWLANETHRNLNTFPVNAYCLPEPSFGIKHTEAYSAYYYYRCSNYSAAIYYCEKAIKNNDYLPPLDLLLGAAKLYNNNIAEAEEIFNKLITTYGMPNAYLGMAEIHIQRGNPDLATQCYVYAVNRGIFGDIEIFKFTSEILQLIYELPTITHLPIKEDLIARVETAEAAENWEAAHCNMQKLLVLEPMNVEYYFKLSYYSGRQNLHYSALVEISLSAILQTNPKIGLNSYLNRALINCALNDANAALIDFQYYRYQADASRTEESLIEINKNKWLMAVAEAVNKNTQNNNFAVARDFLIASQQIDNTTAIRNEITKMQELIALQEVQQNPQPENVKLKTKKNKPISKNVTKTSGVKIPKPPKVSVATLLQEMQEEKNAIIATLDDMVNTIVAAQELLEEQNREAEIAATMEGILHQVEVDIAREKQTAEDIGATMEDILQQIEIDVARQKQTAEDIGAIIKDILQQVEIKVERNKMLKAASERKAQQQAADAEDNQNIMPAHVLQKYVELLTTNDCRVALYPVEYAIMQEMKQCNALAYISGRSLFDRVLKLFMDRLKIYAQNNPRDKYAVQILERATSIRLANVNLPVDENEIISNIHEPNLFIMVAKLGLAFQNNIKPGVHIYYKDGFPIKIIQNYQLSADSLKHSLFRQIYADCDGNLIDPNPNNRGFKDLILARFFTVEKPEKTYAEHPEALLKALKENTLRGLSGQTEMFNPANIAKLKQLIDTTQDETLLSGINEDLENLFSRNKIIDNYTMLRTSGVLHALFSNQFMQEILKDSSWIMKKLTAADKTWNPPLASIYAPLIVTVALSTYTIANSVSLLPQLVQRSAVIVSNNFAPEWVNYLLRCNTIVADNKLLYAAFKHFTPEQFMQCMIAEITEYLQDRYQQNNSFGFFQQPIASNEQYAPINITNYRH